MAIPLDNSIGVHRSHPAFSSPTKETKQMSNYVMDGIAPQVDTGEFETECRDFSIIKAAQEVSLATELMLVKKEKSMRNYPKELVVLPLVSLFLILVGRSLLM